MFNARTLAVSLVFSLLLIGAIGNSIPSSFSQSPTYSVHVSMSNRRINPLWDGRIIITFTASGLGDFLNGTVEVYSDAVNLLVNTFKLQGSYVGTDGSTYQWLDENPPVNYDKKVDSARFGFRGINCEWIDYDVCSKYSQYSSTITMFGTIALDPSAMNPGPYRIKVTFIAHTVVSNYKFDDSASYDVLHSWETNLWTVVVVAGGVLAITVGTYFFAVVLKKKKA